MSKATATITLLTEKGELVREDSFDLPASPENPVPAKTMLWFQALMLAPKVLVWGSRFFVRDGDPSAEEPSLTYREAFGMTVADIESR